MEALRVHMAGPFACAGENMKSGCCSDNTVAAGQKPRGHGVQERFVVGEAILPRSFSCLRAMGPFASFFPEFPDDDDETSPRQAARQPCRDLYPGGRRVMILGTPFTVKSGWRGGVAAGPPLPRCKAKSICW